MTNIRLAILNDLPRAKALTEKCAKVMIANNIFQWNEHYPSLEKLEADILKQELFVLEDKEGIKGIIVLTPTMDEEYIPINWLIPNECNLYIHRLATDPESWGKGFGQQLMAFAEDYAKEYNYVSIRLDTFSQNKRNQRFYEARGFQKLGSIYFPLQSEDPFYCYELVF
jgi:GNAT superfamily N-acetyltransferase